MPPNAEPFEERGYFGILKISEARLTMVILLLLGVAACFLPWVSAEVVILGVTDQSTTNSGYEYIVPLGASYTAPLAVLAVIGFAILAYSLTLDESDSRGERRIRMLGVIAGILVQVGAMAAFVYTLTQAAAEPAGGTSYSVEVTSRYGMLFEGLFGFLIMIGALGFLVKALKALGILTVLIGLMFTAMAVYGMGQDNAVYLLNDEVSNAQEFLLIGVAGLLLGIAVAYVSFVKMSD